MGCLKRRLCSLCLAWHPWTPQARAPPPPLTFTVAASEASSAWRTPPSSGSTGYAPSAAAGLAPNESTSAPSMPSEPAAGGGRVQLQACSTSAAWPPADAQPPAAATLQQAWPAARPCIPPAPRPAQAAPSSLRASYPGLRANSECSAVEVSRLTIWPCTSDSCKGGGGGSSAPQTSARPGACAASNHSPGPQQHPTVGAAFPSPHTHLHAQHSGWLSQRRHAHQAQRRALQECKHAGTRAARGGKNAAGSSAAQLLCAASAERALP